jgi:hypothetical protein
MALPFLTSARDGGEWSASRPGRFTLGGRAPSTHGTGDRVGPTADLITCGYIVKSSSIKRVMEINDVCTEEVQLQS